MVFLLTVSYSRNIGQRSSNQLTTPSFALSSKLSVSLITTAITSSPAVTVKCVFGSLSLPLPRNGTSREIPLSTKAVLKRVAKGSFIVIVMA